MLGGKSQTIESISPSASSAWKASQLPPWHGWQQRIQKKNSTWNNLSVVQFIWITVYEAFCIFFLHILMRRKRLSTQHFLQAFAHSLSCTTVLFSLSDRLQTVNKSSFLDCEGRRASFGCLSADIKSWRQVDLFHSLPPHRGVGLIIGTFLISIRLHACPFPRVQSSGWTIPVLESFRCEIFNFSNSQVYYLALVFLCVFQWFRFVVVKVHGMGLDY